MKINKNHVYITDDGRRFYTAQVVDSYEGTTYDQTVIFEERGDDLSPQVVEYYYGEPYYIETKAYVDAWIANGN